MAQDETKLMPEPEGVVSSFRTYLCHKKVRAAKIQFVTVDINNCFYLLTLKSDQPLVVSTEWYEKHKPTIYGYVVVYEDGYMSYSPEKVFENGYTLLDT